MPDDINVPTFSGPITAVGINEWLLHCEKVFKTWDLRHHNDPVSDETKVNLAGDAISSDGETHDLADWRDLALQAFYSTRQELPGKDGADAYFRNMEERRSVINNASKLDPIATESIANKSHMLFNALTDITSQIMDNDFDLLNATASQVETRVKHVSSLQSSNIPAPATLSGLSGYLLVAQWGVTNGTRFTDFDSLPNNPNSLSQLNSVTLWGNDNQTYTMIEDYQFVFAGSTISGPGLKPKGQAHTYNFQPKEYIKGVTISARDYYTRYDSYYGYTKSSGQNSICYMALTTSTGGSLAAGGQGPKTPQTFKAPDGWQIVGFRGYSTSYLDYNATDSSNYRYPIVGFGIIMAPVPS